MFKYVLCGTIVRYITNAFFLKNKSVGKAILMYPLANNSILTEIFQVIEGLRNLRLNFELNF